MKASSRSTTKRLRPDDPNGALYALVHAWASCIRWAFTEPDARAAFTRDTGIAWPSAPKSALDAMIDQATGYQDHALFMFAQWVTVTLYGDLEDAPEAFQVACRERPLPERATS